MIAFDDNLHSKYATFHGQGITARHGLTLYEMGDSMIARYFYGAMLIKSPKISLHHVAIIQRKFIRRANAAADMP